jgi:5'-nucleotidase
MVVRSRLRRAFVAFVSAVALVPLSAAALASTHSGASDRRDLQVLVTNDDGVGAPGIDALVQRLRALPGVHVTVVAPAMNQSGTGDAITTTPLTFQRTTTVSGYPAIALSGKPADTVLFAVARVVQPDLVVSGINFGQNIGDFAYLSGTVGAARQAARLHIPAIAVSAGIAATVDYATASRLAARLVARFQAGVAAARGPARVWNLDVPSCTAGHVRGVVRVPLGKFTRVTGYTDLPGDVVQPVVDQRDPLAADCTSTATQPIDDVEAFNEGFAPLTVLNPDLTEQ